LSLEKKKKTKTMILQNKLSIKSWAEEDRPREKLMHKGKNQLSDAELIAIILGSGSRNESALTLAQKILKSVENNLNDLGKCTLSELQRFKGVGEAKAIIIAAAMELGRRRQLSDIKKKPKITSSKNAFDIVAPLLIDLPYEEFWLILLNRSNLVIAKEKISTGGVSGTVVDAKLIFSKALDHLASSVILMHNHPSGNLKPSQADIDITKKLKRAGETLDIAVLDHLIVAEGGYFSFADEGLVF